MIPNKPTPAAVKFVSVRMRTLYAGPSGACQPGDTIGLPEAEAASLVAEGYATYAASPATPAKTAAAAKAKADAEGEDEDEVHEDGDYAGFSVAELRYEAAARDLTVTRAEGDGDPVRADFVRALRAADGEIETADLSTPETAARGKARSRRRGP